jgi:hypothetical protein
VVGIRRFSAIISEIAPFLKRRVRQRPLKPGLEETLNAILSSDVLLDAKDDCAVLIR